MIAEVAYTQKITLISTALSVATIAAGSYLTHALKSQFCASNAIWAKSVLKTIVKESLEEVIEEVFLDAFIETVTENEVARAGGNEQTAYWMSTTFTSIREALMGSGTWSNTKTDVNIDANADVRMWYSYSERAEGQSRAEYRKERKSYFKAQMNLMSHQQSLKNAEKSALMRVFTSTAFKGIAHTITSLFLGSFNPIAGFALYTGTEFSKTGMKAYGKYRTLIHEQKTSSLEKIVYDERTQYPNPITHALVSKPIGISAKKIFNEF
ncbi:MAG: hypothetical protein ACTSUT_10955, partial [Promethearchaeota archaeon]